MNKRVGNGANLPASAFSSIGSMLTSSQQEELFVQGKAFSWEDRLSFAAAEVKTLVFDPTAFAGVQIVINPVIGYSTAGPILLDFYTGVEADADGTILVASNRREGFPAPASVLRLGPTVTAPGTRFSGDLIPASGVGVGNANSAGNAQSLPFEIATASKKALVFTNDDGAGTLVQIKLTWFEI